MRSLPLLFLVFVLLTRPSAAQALGQPPATSNPPNPPPSAAAPAPPAGNSHPTTNAAALQMAIDRVTQSNHELLDLLKKQQAVLEDIQYDRRLQSRQIQSLEERLEETLLKNAQLENKVANLESAAATALVAPAPSPQPGAATGNVAASPQPAPVTTPAQPPPPPSTYLPPPEPLAAPGTMSWHRLFTLSGADAKNTDLFQIQGRSWRVLWHNLDRPGKAYANTSALFINAFPRDDTIPQKVCSKLGTGGDVTELNGPGNYYLKVEASGGSWELAVEDFH